MGLVRERGAEIGSSLLLYQESQSKKVVFTNRDQENIKRKVSSHRFA